MSLGLVTAFYLAAAILFILALGGLSNQEKAKRAIWYGIVGMALAVIATIFGGSGHYWLLAPMVIIGGAIGAFVAARVQMTQMPELVAGFHSLVGLAAVFIGLNADVEAHRVTAAVASGAPLDSFSGFALTLAHKTPVELSIMRVEIFLGILIGAITFTGSIVAYGKLAGKIASKPLMLPMPGSSTSRTCLPCRSKAFTVDLASCRYSQSNWPLAKETLSSLCSDCGTISRQFSFSGLVMSMAMMR